MSLAISSCRPGDGESILDGYRPPDAAFDELFAAQAQLRPQWQPFVGRLDALGPQELADRWEQARRLIQENGVTYNVHGDPQGKDRPWELDALPLLLPSSEWAILSAALAQRAKLLNLVLADIYGPQRLLHDGLLPPELILAHPGFLRCCHGLFVARGCYLHLYAAHLARSAEGRWWVLADRTQTPVGAGYAVENRIVISRMLPHIFHDCQVQRLAPFFITVRETLQSLGNGQRRDPRIVLLSAGPASPIYFEDAYLARYLGYTLVEGGDLTVRDSRVYLKTLGGLLQVDVILRRVHDQECDPLEMREDSLLGVPGLTQAARSGNVVLANALGSGLLEAPALMAFLPALSRRLLGEELQISSVSTWWCGQDDSLRYVVDHIDTLVIKHAFHRRGSKPIFGGQLTADERSELISRIKACPREFIAQEKIIRSSAPVWSGGELRPAHISLRTFAVATDDSYEVMPGALTRVAGSTDVLGESRLTGQGSKDVWVLSENPVERVSLLHPAGTPLGLRRSGNDLPSRVADNLYWLGRNVERAEGAIRLLRSIITRLTSESEPGTMGELLPLLAALADQGQVRPAFKVHVDGHRISVAEHEILAFILDETRSGGLRGTLAALRHVASIVRDRISIDSWRILNRVDQDFAYDAPPAPLAMGEMLSMLNRMIGDLLAFVGLGMESMTRGPGWRFLDMGRRQERALQVLSLLRSTLLYASPAENAVLEAVLEVADSSMTYRNRYLNTLQLAPVLDLLIIDETNPRSIGFQIASLSEHVDELPRYDAEPLMSAEQRIVLAALTSLRLCDIHALAEVDKDGRRNQLERLLARLAGQLRSLSDGITHKYLVHAGKARQLTQIGPS